jgi:hypothetical protein
MRKVVLSENNIRAVLGQLKRFFNNPRYGYEHFHNFDCGYKNIKPYSYTTVDKNVDRLEIDFDTFTGKPFIRMVFQEGVSYDVLLLGTVIVFKGGNEIIIQQEWRYSKDKNYIYSVFRLKRLSDEDVSEIAERRMLEKELTDAYWDSVEREMMEDIEDFIEADNLNETV